MVLFYWYYICFPFYPPPSPLSITSAFCAREGGDINQTPKFYKKRYLNNFGDSYWILIGWLVHECPNVITNFNLLLYIIIGDVN